MDNREQKRIADSTIAVQSAQLTSMETTGTIIKTKVSNLEEDNRIADSVRFVNYNRRLANTLDQITSSTTDLFFHYYSTDISPEVLRKEMSKVAAQVDGLMKSEDDNPMVYNDKYFKKIWFDHLDTIKTLRFLIDGYTDDDRMSVLARLCDNNRYFQRRIDTPQKEGMNSPLMRIRKRAGLRPL